MPRLPEFEAPSGKLDIPNIGMEQTAQGARHQEAVAGEIGNKIGQGARDLMEPLGKMVDQHLANMEISSGMLSLTNQNANLQAGYLQKLNQSDPNDHTVGQNYFTSTVEPALEEQLTHFHTPAGQEFAHRYIASQLRDWSTKVIGDQMNRAGTAVVTNALKVVATNSAIASSQPDSATVDGLIAGTKSWLEAQIATSGMSPEQADKLRVTDQAWNAQFLTTAVASRAWNGDIDGSMKMLSMPQYSDVLTGTQRTDLQNKINTIQRMHNEQSMMDEERARRNDEDGANAARNTLISQIKWSADGQPIFPPDYIKNLGQISGKYKLANGAANTAAMKFAVEAPKAFAEAKTDIPNPTVLASWQTKLNNGDPSLVPDILAHAKDMPSEVSKWLPLAAASTDIWKDDPYGKIAVTSMVKSLEVNLALGIPSPLAATKAADFELEFIPAYKKLPPDQRAAALNAEDPKSLISTISAKYRLNAAQIAHEFAVYLPNQSSGSNAPGAVSEPKQKPTGMSPDAIWDAPNGVYVSPSGKGGPWGPEGEER